MLIKLNSLFMIFLPPIRGVFRTKSPCLGD
jgi:hypothetical protein